MIFWWLNVIESWDWATEKHFCSWHRGQSRDCLFWFTTQAAQVANTDYLTLVLPRLRHKLQLYTGSLWLDGFALWMTSWTCYSTLSTFIKGCESPITREYNILRSPCLIKYIQHSLDVVQVGVWNSLARATEQFFRKMAVPLFIAHFSPWTVKPIWCPPKGVHQSCICTATVQ